MHIEDYGFLSNMGGSALVGRDGSIDWLCLPRFDSAASFAALLGDESHGRWLLAPQAEVGRCTRRYRPGTLVLETELETEGGTVRLVDCMPPGDGAARVVRLVEGVRGSVPMQMRLVIRFDYGSIVPWVERDGHHLVATAGADTLRLATPVPLRGEERTTVADFTVEEGERIPFVLDWRPSHAGPAPEEDADAAVERTARYWEEWSARCSYRGEWREAVLSSLAVLKGLTHAETGGIVAAPTTSLPEVIGGVRNWDYRFCWVRDATLTLAVLLQSGYLGEAIAFREWLLRATAGDAADAQIMYGIAGERRLPERELPWLPGFEGSSPVREGNAAAEQFQLDVYGELADAGHIGRMAAAAAGVPVRGPRSLVLWRRFLTVAAYVEEVWREPDEGIWEVRGPRRHFTHSKVMAWTVFDRGLQAIERFGFDGPADRWRQVRAEIHAEVCREGFDAARGTFTQSYGAEGLDASLLLLPAVGFLPGTDERIRGTIEAIERDLTEDGFVYRYATGDEEGDVDGLPGHEGVFLPCSFWLADAMAMAGRVDDARALFERLLALRNDLGLLAEEYDVASRRQVGNFPQAFTHLALIATALRLSEPETASHRPARDT
jgi:GH15 family glucan-1,4-alpha-glucosidase